MCQCEDYVLHCYSVGSLLLSFGNSELVKSEFTDLGRRHKDETTCDTERQRSICEGSACKSKRTEDRKEELCVGKGMNGELTQKKIRKM